MTESEHRCHVPGCALVVERRMLMCSRHWRMVSPATQRLVYLNFRAQQCEPASGVRPTPEWLLWARAAIAEVQTSEATAKGQRDLF